MTLTDYLDEIVEAAERNDIARLEEIQADIEGLLMDKKEMQSMVDVIEAFTDKSLDADDPWI